MVYGIMLTSLVLSLSVFVLDVRRVGADGLVGDLNGDGKVDVKDLYLAGLAFASSVGDRRWNQQADLNGDGKIDTRDLYLIAARYGDYEVEETVVAFVAICPRALNLRCVGRWIRAFIKLPKGYNVADIDVSTILLNGTVPAEPRATVIGNHCGISGLMVKFDRAKVIQVIKDSADMKLERFASVTLEVTGALKDGTLFHGCATIKVIF